MAVDDARRSQKLAISAVQTLLRISSPSVVVDGVWGRESTSALMSAPKEVKLIAETVKTFADSVKPAIAREPETFDPRRWISRREAERLIDNAAKVADVPREWLLFMLDLEPNKRVISGEVHYDSKSVAPSKLYFGLMQIGKPAWTDARKFSKFIGDFEENKFDPALNIMAAAAYMRKNMEYAWSNHRYAGPFSAELMYAMHNQGHTFISSAKRGGAGLYFDGQSSEAKEILATTADWLRSEIA